MTKSFKKSMFKVVFRQRGTEHKDVVYYNSVDELRKADVGGDSLFSTTIYVLNPVTNDYDYIPLAAALAL